MGKIEPQVYNFNDVKGISLNQLNQHYELYKGYVNKINEIWSILDTKKEFSNSNTTYSDMRSLRLGESYALDGVKLHELYFQNLGPYGREPYGIILFKILKDFGSYERFINFLKNTAQAMRGWVILSIDPIDEKLHLYGSDAHDVGAIWQAYPIMVLDVYEHAYMIDFGIDRTKYIETFIQNINWDILNKRLQNYYDMKRILFQFNRSFIYYK